MQQISHVLIHLRRLLSASDHSGFIREFERACSHPHAVKDDFLKALGGEGLCLVLQSKTEHLHEFARRYAKLTLDGWVSAPAAILEELAFITNNDLLRHLKRPFATKDAAKKPPYQTKTKDSRSDNSGVVFQVRRVVQLMHMFMGSGEQTDSIGIRRSIFRSQQERTFLRALSLRFPGLLALPNYPLDQFVNLNKISIEDPEAIRYGFRCRLDAVLVIPDEGDTVAAFELDSWIHDDPMRASRDRMKDKLLKASGIPFFRLRVDDPESTSIDDWYAMLSDEVLPHIDIGPRIRNRKASYRLIPC